MKWEPGDEKSDWKKVVTPQEKREAVDFLLEEEQLSLRKASIIVGIPRTTYNYKATPKDDAPVQEVLTVLTDKYADFGFW